MNFDDLNSLLPLAGACIAGIGWLFRLEACVSTKADTAAAQKQEAEIAAIMVEVAALRAKTEAQDATIKSAMDSHQRTTIEVVRLQEQIKHLTEAIERLLAKDEQDQPQRRRRPAGAA